MIDDRLLVAAEELRRSTDAMPVPPLNVEADSTKPLWLLAVPIVAVAAVLVGLVVLDRGSDEGRAVSPVAGAAGDWLDLPTSPTGMIRVEPAPALLAQAVCLKADSTAGEPVCRQLDGWIEVAYSSEQAAEPVIEIATIFTTMPLEDFISTRLIGNSPSPPEVARTTVEVRDTSAIELVTVGEDVLNLVWQERPDVIGHLRVVGADSTLDPVALAGELILQPWPTSSQPMLAADLGVDWQNAFNHPYAIASHANAEECISIGAIANPTDPFGTTKCGPSTASVWTSGVVNTGDGPDEVRDAVAGLVPSDIATVRIVLKDGRQLEIPTSTVAGQSMRAWAYLVDAEQGERFSAVLTPVTANGSGRAISIDFINPVQDVERICRDGSGVVPDITGLPIYEAAEALKDAGILPTRPLRGDPSQVVTSQDLPPGTERGCGDLSFTTD